MKHIYLNLLFLLCLLFGATTFIQCDNGSGKELAEVVNNSSYEIQGSFHDPNNPTSSFISFKIPSGNTDNFDLDKNYNYKIAVYGGNTCEGTVTNGDVLTVSNKDNNMTGNIKVQKN